MAGPRHAPARSAPPGQPSYQPAIARQSDETEAEEKEGCGLRNRYRPPVRLRVAKKLLGALVSGLHNGVKLWSIARGEIVDHGDLVAGLEKTVDDVRADEAGAAGDQNPH